MVLSHKSWQTSAVRMTLPDPVPAASEIAACPRGIGSVAVRDGF